jgi:hypothetical protein
MINPVNSTMKNHLIVILLITGSLVCFTGYCFALIDWAQDMRTGVYRSKHFEAFYETAAIVLYTTLGLRFMTRKENIF